MARVLETLNRLLPFASPGTPLVQDLIHLAAICVVLYFAPQIQEWVQRQRKHSNSHTTAGSDEHEHGLPTPTNVPEEFPEIEANANGNIQNHIDQGPEQIADTNGLRTDNADDDTLGEAQQGPAEIADAASPRNVGAKKSKSLARKDQRRAYHEFMRSQGEAQRARDAEGADEREAALAREKKRRTEAEALLTTKKAKEREEKRETERQERDHEYRRREAAVSMVRDELDMHRKCDLFRVASQVGGDVDEEWVERLLDASGLLGKKGNVLTMVTSVGWAVRVSEDDAGRLYEQTLASEICDSDGYVDVEKMGEILVSLLDR